MPSIRGGRVLPREEKQHLKTLVSYGLQVLHPKGNGIGLACREEQILLH